MGTYQPNAVLAQFEGRLPLTFSAREIQLGTQEYREDNNMAVLAISILVAMSLFTAAFAPRPPSRVVISTYSPTTSSIARAKCWPGDSGPTSRRPSHLNLAIFSTDTALDEMHHSSMDFSSTVQSLRRPVFGSPPLHRHFAAGRYGRGLFESITHNIIDIVGLERGEKHQHRPVHL